MFLKTVWLNPQLENRRCSPWPADKWAVVRVPPVSLPQALRSTAQAVQGLVAPGKRYRESMAEVLPVSRFSELGERKGAAKRVAPKSARAAENFGCFVGDFYMLVQIDEPSTPCELVGFFLFIVY